MPSITRLTSLEARIIGCLIEKQITTPDQYPLSLNALINACNQKSNREPVLALTESEVQEGLEGLAARRLVTEQTGYGSRVSKFQHRFCNTEFGSLKFTPQELAIVCELLLRGAQMPGELRARADRLAKFRDVGELEEVLAGLATRADGPFVLKLDREPGRRESRYLQLFSADASLEAPAQGAGTEPPASTPGRTPREELIHLRTEVDSLRAEVAVLLADVERVRRALE